MKSLLLSGIALWLFALPLCAQHHLYLTVEDATTHQAIPNVTCKVYAARKFKTYGLTNPEGKVTVSIAYRDSVVVTLFGYQQQSFHILTQQDVTRRISLKQKASRLKEVVIKAPPLYIKKDTVVYKVSAFTDKQDRHLEDVLKKLPGITVSDQGIVKYNGDAINHLYVEGQDLLGSNYTQLTKNMPIDAVQDVELYQHNQHKKVLRNKIVTKNPALNIKLKKKFKFRPFGEAEGGIGESPLLWKNRAFLSQIGKKMQTVITGEMNNIGNKNETSYAEEIKISDFNMVLPELNSIISPPNLGGDFDDERSLWNKTIDGNFNHLVKLNKDAFIRLNMVAYRDHSTQRTDFSHYYGGEHPFRLDESYRVDLLHKVFQPQLTYEWNADKVFLNDVFKFTYDEQLGNNYTLSNGKPFLEQTHNKPVSYQNYLNGNFTVGDMIFNFASKVRGIHQHDRMFIEDRRQKEMTTLRQFYLIDNLISKTDLSTYFSLWGNQLDVDLMHTYSYNKYGYAGEDVRRKVNELTFTPDYGFLLGNTKLSLTLPIVLQHIDYKDKAERTRHTYLYVQPYIGWRYKFSEEWKMSLSTQYNQSLSNDVFYSPYALQQNYRNFYHSNKDNFFKKEWTSSFALKYLNLANLFFVNAKVSYSLAQKESIMNIVYRPERVDIYMEKHNNMARYWDASLNIEKTILDWGLKLKGESNFSNTTNIISQDGVLFKNTTRSLNLGVTLNYRKIKWFNINWQHYFGWLWFKNPLSQMEPMMNQHGKGTLTFIPHQKIFVKTLFEYYVNDMGDHHKYTGFLNGELTYKPNKKWQVSLKARNLLNYTTYHVYEQMGLNTMTTNMPLRGRDVMVSAAFNF